MRGQALQSISGMRQVGKNYQYDTTSKHRHIEPEYWFNKLNKRRKLAKIAKKSRKRNK